MPPSKHALLSASSSHRWLNCNPSARLEQEFADRETEAAAEGTAAHALAEQMLYDNGFSGEFESAQEPEIEAGLTVTIPKETLSEGAMANLERLVESKGNLIRKALGVEQLPILVTDEAVSFPWFPGEPTADEVKAYTHLVTALCEMARNQKRITAKEKETDNEKYAFRCFLLRLGFIGSEFKAERKILLRNLTGSSAFKSGAKKDAATEGDSCPVSAESEGGDEQCE